MPIFLFFSDFFLISNSFYQSLNSRVREKNLLYLVLTSNLSFLLFFSMVLEMGGCKMIFLKFAHFEHFFVPSATQIFKLKLFIFETIFSGAINGFRESI